MQRQFDEFNVKSVAPASERPSVSVTERNLPITDHKISAIDSDSFAPHFNASIKSAVPSRPPLSSYTTSIPKTTASTTETPNMFVTYKPPTIPSKTVLQETYQKSIEDPQSGFASPASERRNMQASQPSQQKMHSLSQLATSQPPTLMQATPSHQHQTPPQQEPTPHSPPEKVISQQSATRKPYSIPTLKELEEQEAAGLPPSTLESLKKPMRLPQPPQLSLNQPLPISNQVPKKSWLDEPKQAATHPPTVPASQPQEQPNPTQDISRTDDEELKQQAEERRKRLMAAEEVLENTV